MEDKRRISDCRRSICCNTNKGHYGDQPTALCQPCGSKEKTWDQTHQEEANKITIVEKMTTRTAGSAAERPQSVIADPQK